MLSLGINTNMKTKNPKLKVILKSKNKAFYSNRNDKFLTFITDILTNALESVSLNEISLSVTNSH